MTDLIARLEAAEADAKLTETERRFLTDIKRVNPLPRASWPEHIARQNMRKRGLARYDRDARCWIITPAGRQALLLRAIQKGEADE